MLTFKGMRSRAFTLVEVIVSIALIAIALLGVMGSIAYGTRHSGSGEELTEATHIARSYLSYIQEATLIDTIEPNTGEWLTEASGINDPDEGLRPLDDPPFGGLEFTGPQISRYRRRIRSQRVSEDNSDHRYGLARVQVTIFWESKQGERNVLLTGLVSTARD
ncbi:MAG: type II secretion system protein [Candidatus Eremiobacteraeota bacterium]|nr:type II secretion system protein [Candidatus Eremiobacteraeota bacterium]